MPSFQVWQRLQPSSQGLNVHANSMCPRPGATRASAVFQTLTDWDALEHSSEKAACRHNTQTGPSKPTASSSPLRSGQESEAHVCGITAQSRAQVLSTLVTGTWLGGPERFRIWWRQELTRPDPQSCTSDGEVRTLGIPGVTFRKMLSRSGGSCGMPGPLTRSPVHPSLP